MRELRSEFLFRLTLLAGAEPHPVGAVPHGTRRVTPIVGGHFEGPRLRGTVEPVAGGAWVVVGGDGAVRLDARVTPRTDDGARIYMHYPGIGYGPPEVMALVNSGQAADPADYYFRTAAPLDRPANVQTSQIQLG